MRPAARLGDSTAHGGVILTGEATVLIGGRPAARVGDSHMCPMVNGPVVHTGGIINMGSVTVHIGNALAARVGDACSCQSVGAAGVGVPSQVGPGAGESTLSSGDRNANGWQGPGGEIRATDSDQDGSLDTVEGEGSLLRHNYNRNLAGNGRNAVGIQNTLDVGFADGGGTARGNYGYTLQQRLQAGVVRDRGSFNLGQPTDSNNRYSNPFMALSWDARALRAAEESGTLMGDDGQRIGLGNEGHVAADWGSVDFNFQSNLPFLPQNSTLGFSLGAGAGLNEHLYYDRRDGQLHLVLGGEWAWLGIEGDMPLAAPMDQIDMVVDHVRGVIGQVTGSSASPTPPVIPNVIVNGDATVLIGG